VKRLINIVILVIRLVTLVLLGLNDRDISFADTSISDDRTAGSVSKTGNSSASAIITIAIYTLPNV